MSQRLCAECSHLEVRHSSVPGVGCLHTTTVWPTVMATTPERVPCPCTRSGTSAADQ